MRVLVLLLVAFTGACASTGSIPRPYPGAPAPPGADAARVPAGEPAPSARSPSAAIEIARALVGTRYRDGGTDPDGGFDCSGFVQYVFGQAGIGVPRSVREQWQAGVPVEPGSERPGDLVFFVTSGRDVSHVGIVLENGTFVHAPSARGSVRVERWSSDYWARRYAGARRIE